MDNKAQPIKYIVLETVFPQNHIICFPTLARAHTRSALFTSKSAIIVLRKKPNLRPRKNTLRGLHSNPITMAPPTSLRRARSTAPQRKDTYCTVSEDAGKPAWRACGPRYPDNFMTALYSAVMLLQPRDRCNSSSSFTVSVCPD